MFIIKKLNIFHLLFFISIVKCINTSSILEETTEYSYEEAETDNKICENTLEKVQNLFESLKQIDPKTIKMIMDNMDLIEKHLHKMVENIIEEKLEEIENKISEKYQKDEIPPDLTDNITIAKCPNKTSPIECHGSNGCRNRIYNITLPPFHHETFPVLCDLETEGGGWIIIQRRQDGSENFNRNWTEYAQGFGDLNGEFFIGLRKLHALTALGEPQELYVILEDFEGKKVYARYGEFKINSEKENFKLTVGAYTGTAGNSLTPHNGFMFSTRDRDNDKILGSCADFYKSGWWFFHCYYSNLNGEYHKEAGGTGGIIWRHFRGFKYSLKFTQMMIRPKIA